MKRLLLFILAMVCLDASAAVFQNYWVSNSIPIATNAFTVRVSAKGRANGLSAYPNDMANFGPDTPGTVTSGLQEALNAFTPGTNQGPYVAPMKLKIGAGDFFFTNVLTLSNSFVTGIEIEGEGFQNTTLIYAGAAASNYVQITGGAHSGGSLNLPFHVTVRDLTMTALLQRTNVMMYLSGCSYINIEEVNFTGWNVRTNTDSGAAISMLPQAAAMSPGLVGLHINQHLDNATYISDCVFSGLAVGMRLRTDHPIVNNATFNHISAGDIGGFAFSTNSWPTNSIYNLGAGVILEENVYDATFTHNIFFNCRAAFVGVDCGRPPTLIGCAFESSGGVYSDTELAPVLINPLSTGGSLQDADIFIAKTPVSPNYPTNYYQLTADPHPFGVSYGAGRYDLADYAFYVRANNDVEFFVDSQTGQIFGDGTQIFNIRAHGIDALGNDPNADRGVFWDDSAGALKYFTFGTGLTMTDTTLTAAGGSGFPLSADANAGVFGITNLTYLAGERDEPDHSPGRITFLPSSGPGDVNISGGTNTAASDSQAGGSVNILGGRGGTGSTLGGDINLTGGYGATGSGGNINLTPGTGASDGVINANGTIEVDVAVNTPEVNGTGPGGGLLVIRDSSADTKTTIDGENNYIGTAGNIYLTNGVVQLAAPGVADGVASGITRAGTAGTALAFGDLVVLDVTDSRWELADANAASGADGDSRGMIGICVLAAAGDGDPTTILLQGIVRADTAFPTFTVNAPVYVSETAGDITATSPTTEDNVVRILGVATTADEIYFDPDRVWTVYDAP